MICVPNLPVIKLPARYPEYVIGVRHGNMLPYLTTSDSIIIQPAILDIPFDVSHDRELYYTLMSRQTTRISTQALRNIKATSGRCKISLPRNTEWKSEHMYTLMELPVHKDTGLVLVNDHKNDDVCEVIVIDPITYDYALPFQDTLSDLF